MGFESGRGPEQIHLALTGREGEMRVMFVAEDPKERHVRYGEKEGEWEGDVAVARVWRYEREDMCHAPANESVGWRDPGWIFDAVMSNLKGGVKYYCFVGCCITIRFALFFISLPFSSLYGVFTFKNSLGLSLN